MSTTSWPTNIWTMYSSSSCGFHFYKVDRTYLFINCIHKKEKGEEVAYPGTFLVHYCAETKSFGHLCPHCTDREHLETLKKVLDENQEELGEQTLYWCSDHCEGFGNFSEIPEMMVEFSLLPNPENTLPKEIILGFLRIMSAMECEWTAMERVQ